MDRHEWLCVMRLDDFIEIWKEGHNVEVKTISMIVHCRDCRHWNSETNGCKRNPSVEAWYDSDFCKYGERREDGKISNT